MAIYQTSWSWPGAEPASISSTLQGCPLRVEQGQLNSQFWAPCDLKALGEVPEVELNVHLSMTSLAPVLPVSRSGQKVAPLSCLCLVVCSRSLGWGKMLLWGWGHLLQILTEVGKKLGEDLRVHNRSPLSALSPKYRLGNWYFKGHLHPGVHVL